MDILKIPSPLFPLYAYLSICRAKHTTSQDTASSTGPLLSLKTPTLIEHPLIPSLLWREFSLSLLLAPSDSTMRTPNFFSLLLTTIPSKIYRMHWVLRHRTSLPLCTTSFLLAFSEPCFSQLISLPSPVKII